jgi:hypothetical protein
MMNRIPKHILLTLFVIFLTVFLDFSVENTSLSTGASYAQCPNYTPTHRTEIDLWIRNDLPRYSLRTGGWILGKKIGLIQKHTQFQMIGSKVVGLTQVWMEICFKLPDENIVGGKGYWIWAGRVNSEENVTNLNPQSRYQDENRRIAFSFIKSAWAQTDLPPVPDIKTQLFVDTKPEPSLELEDNTDVINSQLNSWEFTTLKYLGIYIFLLFGMIVGNMWDWLNLKPTEQKTDSENPFIRNMLKTIIGSFISFSFFIGPVMGIGEIGFRFSSAILAFHFGLVHYDPTELVFTLRSKYSAKNLNPVRE